MAEMVRVVLCTSRVEKIKEHLPFDDRAVVDRVV